jgi:hypothetical protein
MKKLILITAAAILGVMLSSEAFAWTVSGKVFFHSDTLGETPCALVTLCEDSTCNTVFVLDHTDCCGNFDLSGPWPDTVWVKMEFEADPPADSLCNVQQGCSWTGTCSDDDDIKMVTTSDVGALYFDLSQANCYRVGGPGCP